MAFGVACSSGASAPGAPICKHTDSACLTTAIERFGDRMCRCANRPCAHQVASEMTAAFDAVIEAGGALASAKTEPELSRSKAAMVRFTDCYTTIVGIDAK